MPPRIQWRFALKSKRTSDLWDAAAGWAYAAITPFEVFRNLLDDGNPFIRVLAMLVEAVIGLVLNMKSVVVGGFCAGVRTII
jgi:hypothetical protein